MSPSGVLAAVSNSASDIYREVTLERGRGRLGCGRLGVGVAMVTAAAVLGNKEIDEEEQYGASGILLSVVDRAMKGW